MRRLVLKLNNDQIAQRTSIAPSLKSAYVACDQRQMNLDHACVGGPYDTILYTVPEHHGDSTALLHPLSLKSSCKSIALNIQILIRQGSVLMTSYHPTNQNSAHPSEWKEESKQKLTQVCHHTR
jgi:hypothetical protein